MSVGRRSGVNCTRRNSPEKHRASALASVVLPTPGTSSMSRCWPAQERHQHVLDGLGLAEDHAAELGLERGERRGGRFAHGCGPRGAPQRRRRRTWVPATTPGRAFRPSTSTDSKSLLALAGQQQQGLPLEEDAREHDPLRACGRRRCGQRARGRRAGRRSGRRATRGRAGASDRRAGRRRRRAARARGPPPGGGPRPADPGRPAARARASRGRPGAPGPGSAAPRARRHPRMRAAPP